MQPQYEATFDAAIIMRFADAALQNTIKLRVTASEIGTPKLDWISTLERKKGFWST